MIWSPIWSPERLVVDLVVVDAVTLSKMTPLLLLGPIEKVVCIWETVTPYYYLLKLSLSANANFFETIVIQLWLLEVTISKDRIQMPGPPG